MTSTHGIILAAIGLAMFAIMAVVWVLWRRRKCTCHYGVNEGGGTLHVINELCPLHGISSVVDHVLASSPVVDQKRAEVIPYSPSIQGTGSRPEAPWVTRGEFRSECDDTTAWFKEIEARLGALESGAELTGWLPRHGERVVFNGCAVMDDGIHLGGLTGTVERIDGNKWFIVAYDDEKAAGMSQHLFDDADILLGGQCFGWLRALKSKLAKWEETNA